MRKIAMKAQVATRKDRRPGYYIHKFQAPTSK